MCKLNGQGRAPDVHKEPLAKRVVLLDSARAPLFFIIIIALSLRAIGIEHGFPYIYHPDEPTIIRSALGIRFDPNPHHFDWPHLYIYLNYFSYMLFAKLRDLLTIFGLKPQLAQIAPIIYNDNLIFYLLSRLFSATLGAFTVVPIYLWVKKLVNQNAALLSSTLLALAPLHVRNSHYALIDVPMLFFLSWSLYFSTTSVSLSGLFLGFSASTKYNGLLGGLFIVIYLLLQTSKTAKQRALDIIKLGLFTILGFVIGTPLVILDFKTFTRTDGPQGALWQFTNVGKVDFLQQLSHFLTVLLTKLPENLGYGALLMFAVGVCIVIRTIVKRRTMNMTLASAILTFLLLTFYVSGLERNRSQYYMIVYPYLFLVAGWALSKLSDGIKRVPYKIALSILVLLPSFVLSVQNILNLQTKSAATIYGGDIEKDAKIKM